MASLGTSVRFPCPVCDEPIQLPVGDLGTEESTLTVTIDLAPLRDHVTATHQPGEVAAGAQPAEPASS